MRKIIIAVAGFLYIASLPPGTWAAEAARPPEIPGATRLMFKPVSPDLAAALRAGLKAMNCSEGAIPPVLLKLIALSRQDNLSQMRLRVSLAPLVLSLANSGHGMVTSFQNMSPDWQQHLLRRGALGSAQDMDDIARKLIAFVNQPQDPGLADMRKAVAWLRRMKDDYSIYLEPGTVQEARSVYPAALGRLRSMQRAATGESLQNVKTALDQAAPSPSAADSAGEAVGGPSRGRPDAELAGARDLRKKLGEANTNSRVLSIILEIGDFLKEQNPGEQAQRVLAEALGEELKTSKVNRDAALDALKLMGEQTRSEAVEMAVVFAVSRGIGIRKEDEEFALKAACVMKELAVRSQSVRVKKSVLTKLLFRSMMVNYSDRYYRLISAARDSVNETLPGHRESKAGPAKSVPSPAAAKPGANHLDTLSAIVAAAEMGALWAIALIELVDAALGGTPHVLAALGLACALLSTAVLAVYLKRSPR